MFSSVAVTSEEVWMPSSWVCAYWFNIRAHFLDDDNNMVTDTATHGSWYDGIGCHGNKQSQVESSTQQIKRF